MKYMMKNVKFLLFILLLSTTYSFSQDQIKRTIGLTALVQGQQFGIQMPLWFASSVSLAPFIEFKYVENQGVDYIVGIVPKFYYNMNKKLVPYLGAKFGFAFYEPDSQLNKSGTTDRIMGIAFGGEYFFDPRFSIGVEGQINYTKSDKYSSRFGNPGGSNINTGSVITANIYF
jgi:hypothetical protein